MSELFKDIPEFVEVSFTLSNGMKLIVDIYRGVRDC
jgi:hypothetical protein